MSYWSSNEHLIIPIEIIHVKREGVEAAPLRYGNSPHPAFTLIRVTSYRYNIAKYKWGEAVTNSYAVKYRKIETVGSSSRDW